MNKTTAQFINDAVEIHGNKYDYSLVNYKNNEECVEILCPEHGKFIQSPSSHLSGRGCHQCGKIRRVLKRTNNKEHFVIQSRKKHGDKYDYSQSVYVNSKVKVKIICPEHGEFYRSPNSHMRGSNCTKCAIASRAAKRRMTLSAFVEKSKKVHGNKYDYSDVTYTNNNTGVKIKCIKHNHIFIQTPNSHLSGRGCPICAKIAPTSKGEIDFLNHINIPIENRQFPIMNLNYIVDGIDTVSNTIYEYLGDYWHGNPKIFDHKKIAGHRNGKTFGQVFKSTFARFHTLKKSGYTVKYIWETDWLNWSKYKNGPLPIKEYN